MRFSPFVLLFSAMVLTCVSARAASPYVETGFGVGEIEKADNIYGPTAPGTTHMGLGANLTFAVALGSASDLMQLHLGLQSRLTNGSFNGTTYNLLSAYPMIRLETSRIYLGFGVTPLVMEQSGSGGNMFSGYNKVASSLSEFGEVGLLWRVVPFFNLAVAVSGEHIALSGGESATAIQGTLQFRFFFGEGQNAGSKHKYDGWRYPFGIELF